MFDVALIIFGSFLQILKNYKSIVIANFFKSSEPTISLLYSLL